MTEIQCAICGENIRKDIALLDAKWESIKDKYLCRECAKKIAQLVLDNY